MSEIREFLTPDPEATRRDLEEIGPIELLVGIPSYNEADTITHVVRQADLGLVEHFGGTRAAIVNVDNNSPDDTRGVFLGVPTETEKIYLSTPEGVKGKGNNFLNLFLATKALGARAVVVVDADLQSITPDWIRLLAMPIVEDDLDFVTPIYARNEYDGTITNNICYPVLFGLLGQDVRQPIGGDFGFSGRFGDRLLNAEWLDSTRQFGIDIFMTLQAMLGDFRIGQSGLGAKVHKPSAPKLGPMFTQVVTTLFDLLVENRGSWQRNGRPVPKPLYGAAELAEPQKLAVDYKDIKARALELWIDHQAVLAERLAPETFALARQRYAEEKMRIGAGLWSRIVYDLLYSFENDGDRGECVEALKPLFFGRVASFIKATLDLSHEDSEARILRQAEQFRRSRGYLFRKSEV